MKLIILVSSCLALIASAIMAIKTIKDKKSIKDPYFLLSVVTFIIAVWMIARVLG